MRADLARKAIGQIWLDADGQEWLLIAATPDCNMVTLQSVTNNEAQERELLLSELNSYTKTDRRVDLFVYERTTRSYADSRVTVTEFVGAL